MRLELGKNTAAEKPAWDGWETPPCCVVSSVRSHAPTKNAQCLLWVKSGSHARHVEVCSTPETGHRLTNL
jgi:hypothetical protein